MSTTDKSIFSRPYLRQSHAVIDNNKNTWQVANGRYCSYAGSLAVNGKAVLIGRQYADYYYGVVFIIPFHF